MSEYAAAPRPRFVLFANAELPQLPVQNELASFMSSQIPSNSTPSALQLRSASVHHASVFGANQSGKTVYPGQTCPMYSEPSGFLMNVSRAWPEEYGA
jgi:hypothetical protein